MTHSLDKKRINEIIRRRLFRVSKAVKCFFPPILSTPEVSWAVFPADTYLLVVILADQDRKRIQTLISKNYHPFPGLITQVSDASAAFRLENSRNSIIESCTVENGYSISLGKDSTAMLANHTQSLNTQELGPYSYQIPLAYIVSYGDQINEVTVYEYLDELIAYTVRGWRSRRAH